MSSGGGTLVATLGRRSYIGDASFSTGNKRAHLLIGRYCSIAFGIRFLIGLNHRHYTATTYPFEDFELGATQPDGNANHAYDVNHYQVILGNDVWIGADVTILGGVRVGNGAVIGTRAVVTRDVPPYAIVAGNPAHVVKYRFPQEVRDRMQRIKWWNWDDGVPQARWREMADPEAFSLRYDVPLAAVEDETSSYLKAQRAAGRRVSMFVFDPQEPRTLWREVVGAYLAAGAAGSKDVLWLEMTEADAQGAAMDELRQLLDADGHEGATVCLHASQAIPALDVLPFVDRYVTGCSETSSLCVDFAESFGVPVVSGCDYGSGLFS